MTSTPLAKPPLTAPLVPLSQQQQQQQQLQQQQPLPLPLRDVDRDRAPFSRPDDSRALQVRAPADRGPGYLPPHQDQQLMRAQDGRPLQGSNYLSPLDSRPLQGSNYLSPLDSRPLQGNSYASPYDSRPLQGSRYVNPHDSRSQGLLPRAPEHGHTYLTPQESRALQLRAPDRGSLFLTSDDHILAREIERLHSPDARAVHVRPLFRIVEEVIQSATQTLEGFSMGALAQREPREARNPLQGIGEVTDSPLIIERVHCEITTGPISGTDAHTTAMRVLSLLSHFSWEAKSVMAMAAFALTYGDFWLLVQIYATNPLAKSMALIKGLPTVVEHVGAYKRQFEAINNLIKSMLETTRCVIEFGELPAVHITDEDPEVKAALNLFPTAVYWVIKSAIAAATQISILTSTNHEYMTAAAETWEISQLISRLKTINDHLRRVLNAMYNLIGEKMEDELYKKIKIFIYEKVHMDNLPVLKILICEDDSVAALYDCQAKRRVHLETLRRRNVLLLISGLDITHEELYILEQAYTESKIHAYEVIWIPIVDPLTPWTDAMRNQLETLQASMPWYSVNDPKIIRKACIKFFRQDWHFYGKPILVVLDPQGRVVSPNAIHMMWIWQSEAFPFTSPKEEELWDRQIWNLELLSDAIDGRILDWMREGKYIMLYGGGNLKWVREFTTAAKDLARDLRIQLEMLYVGKSHHKEMVQKMSAAIAVEQLSHCWQDPNQVWYFWTRLESMFYSKMQLGRVHENRDIILQEIQRLKSFDKGPEGWVVLAKGSNILVTAHGRIALTVLEEYEIWKKKAHDEGLDVAFPAYYTELYMKEHICPRIDFPVTSKMPDRMVCSDCNREMQKFKTFVCCHEDLSMLAQENSPPVAPYEG